MHYLKLTFILILANITVYGQIFNGFALYNTQNSTTTYLMDESQGIAHQWNMNANCNYTVQLKKNGNLIRGFKNTGNILNGAASGGGVQEIAPDGSIVWEYIYSDANHLSHHDLTLIGDNVLLTAWEVKSANEVTNAGYSGNVGSSGKWPTHFIELEPNGNGSANIVWEWHIWDHLCQDVDPSKPNYVTNISDHPELIDINMIQSQGGGGPGGGGGDWFHVNGVDYNEDLDQIAFSSRFASEIYIIDHSTTTAEAASHSDGNSGMGGDILYRWGNPSNYNMSGNQTIPNAVHDVRWIKNDGRANGGYLQIFNNSGISNSQSSIDGIATPIDPNNPYRYERLNGQAFGPSSYTTRDACEYFYQGSIQNGSASGQSASDRMSNGNIFINASAGQSGAGVMYELDSLGNLVWGPYAAQSPKGFRYECDYPGIIALENYMNNTATTSCFNTTNIIDNTADDLLIYPNPAKSNFTIKYESSNSMLISISVTNSIGQKIYTKNISGLNGIFKETINLESYSDGIYFISIEEQGIQLVQKKVSHIK